MKFVGFNEMHINQATMCRALEVWLNENRFGTSPLQVSNVRRGKDPDSFFVTFHPANAQPAQPVAVPNKEVKQA